jgi:hypothetical protein
MSVSGWFCPIGLAVRGDGVMSVVVVLKSILSPPDDFEDPIHLTRDDYVMIRSSRDQANNSARRPRLGPRFRERAVDGPSHLAR